MKETIFEKYGFENYDGNNYTDADLQKFFRLVRLDTELRKKMARNRRKQIRVAIG